MSREFDLMVKTMDKIDEVLGIKKPATEAPVDILSRTLTGERLKADPKVTNILRECEEALDVLAEDAEEAGYTARAEAAANLATRARGIIAELEARAHGSQELKKPQQNADDHHDTRDRSDWLRKKVHKPQNQPDDESRDENADEN